MRLVQLIFLVIGLGGTALVERESRLGSPNSPTSIAGLSVSLVCLGAFLLLYVWSRRQIPAEAKDLVTASRGQWEKHFFVHFDIAIPSIVVGITIESVFVSVASYLLIMPLLYVIATVVAYYGIREKIVAGPWLSLFAFCTSWSSVPFSVIGLRDPGLLSRFFGEVGVTVAVSRSISYLFVPWTQMCLVLSSAILVSQAWRSRLLLRNGLGVKDLQDRYELALERISTMQSAVEFREVFSDVPYLLSLFEDGNFTTIVGLGWGMVDRGLATIMNSKLKMRGRALKMGISEEEYDTCYTPRTDMVHKGKPPTFRDALSLLLLVKHILERVPGMKKSGNETLGSVTSGEDR